MIGVPPVRENEAAGYSRIPGITSSADGFTFDPADRDACADAPIGIQAYGRKPSPIRKGGQTSLRAIPPAAAVNNTMFGQVPGGRRARHATRGKPVGVRSGSYDGGNVPQNIPQTYSCSRSRPPSSNTVARLTSITPSSVVQLRYRLRYKKGLLWSRQVSEWQKRRGRPWRSWPKSITMVMRPRHWQKRYSVTTHRRLMRSKSWGGWPSGNMAKRAVQSVRIQSTARRRLLRLRQAGALGESCIARGAQNDSLKGFDKYYYH